MTPALQSTLTQIATAAVATERKTGLPAELTAAQCIFESGWLNYAPGNNCFGIKADGHGTANPPTQTLDTFEYIKGVKTPTTAEFAAYATIQDCFDDYARLLTDPSGPYAQAWAAYQQNHDLELFIIHVGAIYSTTPGYGVRLMQEIRSQSFTSALAAARAAT